MCVAQCGFRVLAGKILRLQIYQEHMTIGTARHNAQAALLQNFRHDKNAIPNDPQKPFVTSGIRIGSAAMTTRGFKELEAELLANLIADVLDAPADEKVISRVVAEVKKLTVKFPVYDY